MKNNQAIGLLSEALTKHNYPLSYLTELSRFLGIDISEAQEISTHQKSKLQHVLFQLSKQTPVEYIVGEALFYERRFIVNRNVLIPRFDTERVIRESLRIASKLQEKTTIIDIGTGSGALIITLEIELQNSPLFEFVAIDISPDAIEIAKKNASSLGVLEKITFQTAENFPKESSLPYLPANRHVFIVSNPPYIAETAIATLPESVKNYEPDLALRIQPTFIPELQKYITFLHKNNKTIYAAFEYSNAAGDVIFRFANPLQVDLQELLSA